MWSAADDDDEFRPMQSLGPLKDLQAGGFNQKPDDSAVIVDVLKKIRPHITAAVLPDTPIFTGAGFAPGGYISGDEPAQFRRAVLNKWVSHTGPKRSDDE